MNAVESDDAAMADLQASVTWRTPRCRWIQSGFWIVPAGPQDTALYEAAEDAGYVDMREAGRVNRTGAPEPAWNISVTDDGKTESAACAASRSGVVGVPVARRQFGSAKRIEVDLSGYTVFDVDFTWVPTPVGDRVRHILTGTQAVEVGPATARVRMGRGPRMIQTESHGWSVLSIEEEPWHLNRR